MYRRKLESLPPDFTFPRTLEGLGYFVNEDDQIRMIEDPELPFHFHASKNERFVETQKAAMNDCMSDIVMSRLRKLGMITGRLPIEASPDEAHVPILVSENLRRARRVVVYIGDNQELGFLSGRIMSQDGLGLGSVVNMVRDTLGTTLTPTSPGKDGGNDERPTRVAGDVGLIIANPGQLVWHRRGRRAVSFEGWHALPRPSAAHESRPITDINRIPRNGNPLEHAECLFEQVVAPLVEQGSKVDVVVLNHSIDDVVAVLCRDWERRWAGAVSAVACASASPYTVGGVDADAGFREFWGRRARLYITCDQPAGTPMTGRQVVGCNVYSSGVRDFAESIVPRAYQVFLDYFRIVDWSEDFENAPQDIPPEDVDGQAWGDDGDGGGGGGGGGWGNPDEPSAWEENMEWQPRPDESDVLRPGDEVIEVEI